jgi:hypothetical protein
MDFGNRGIMRGADQLQPGRLERSAGVEPPEAKMTVADYILFTLHTLGSTAFHTTRGMESTPLVTASSKQSLLKPLFWDNLQEAVWAGQSVSRNQGLGTILGPESLLSGIFEGIISSSHELLPMLFVVRRSLRVETKELCGLPLSMPEKGRREIRGLIRKFSAAYFLIDDRRTAAARIDKAIDASLELLQPVVIELPDEVAQSYIPSHTYRKTVFNYEDQDLIKSCWLTILSRLEQAQSPVFILGHECWPPLWHHTLLILSEEFHAETIASEDLFGHLGSYQPEKFQGYLQLNTIDIDLEDAFDSIFIFGVPSDTPWLETITTHHDLSSGWAQELFTLNSSGVSFGDGREFMPSPCLKEFFCRAPLIVGAAWTVQNKSVSYDLPLWYSLVSTLKDPSSPLFVPHDGQLIASVIKMPPFAKIFIQPENAEDSWVSVSIAAWTQGDSSHVIFAAGNIDSLMRAFGRLHHHPVPTNLIFLLQDSENSTQEAASLLSATILTNAQDVDNWLTHAINTSRRPGLIWMAPEGEE